MPRGKRSQSLIGTEPVRGSKTGIDESVNVIEERITDAEGGVSRLERELAETSKRTERTEPTGIPTVSPIDLRGVTSGGDHGDGSGDAPKRRGRKPGSKNRTTQEETPQDLNEYVAGFLVGAHSLIATLAHMPEVEMPQDAADKIAKNATKVMAFYKKSFDPRNLAWMQLGASCLEFYGPMAFQIYQTHKDKPKAVPQVIQPRTATSQPQAAPAAQPAANLSEMTPMMLNHEHPREEEL